MRRHFWVAFGLSAQALFVFMVPWLFLWLYRGGGDLLGLEPAWWPSPGQAPAAAPAAPGPNCWPRRETAAAPRGPAAVLRSSIAAESAVVVEPERLVQVHLDLGSVGLRAGRWSAR